MLKSALGYDYEETITEIIESPDGTKKKHVRKIVKHMPGSNTAQIFWLKNRRPAIWRDKPIEVENSETMEKLDNMLAEVWKHAFNT